MCVRAFYVGKRGHFRNVCQLRLANARVSPMLALVMHAAARRSQFTID